MFNCLDRDWLWDFSQREQGSVGGRARRDFSKSPFCSQRPFKSDPVGGESQKTLSHLPRLQIQGCCVHNSSDWQPPKKLNRWCRIIQTCLSWVLLPTWKQIDSIFSCPSLIHPRVFVIIVLMIIYLTNKSLFFKRLLLLLSVINVIDDVLVV